MLNKLTKAFGKKAFKGEGRRLGSNESASEDNKEGKDSSRGKQGDSRRQTDSRSQQPAAPRSYQGRPQKLGSTAEPSHPHKDTADSGPSQHQSEAESTNRGAQREVDSANDLVTLSNGASSEAATFDLLDLDLARAVASEELQLALAQLAEGAEEPRAVLKRLFANILRSPKEIKFRRIRLGNPKIQAAIVDADGGLETLQAVGFHVVMDDSEEGATGDAYAVLPDDDELLQTNAALVLLGYTHPSGPEITGTSQIQGQAEPATRPAKSNNQLASPCERETEVVLPSGPEGAAQVQDWVFKRTPAELKAALLDARRKREQNEMLMTKATRAKLQKGETPTYTKGTVRVRLPEGLLLQGMFNAQEPVAEIYNWVTDCLADPSTLFELVLPDRKPLVTSMGTLKSANLLPNVLLIFRSSARGAAEKLTIKEGLLRST